MKSIFYGAGGAHEIVTAVDKYEDAERINKHIVCWVIPPYADDVKERLRERHHFRANLEVQLIVSYYRERLYTNCDILYFSPLSVTERLKHAEGLTTAPRIVRYVHLDSESLRPVADVSGGSVWIVDEYCTLRHIEYVLKQAGRFVVGSDGRPERLVRRLIFFVPADRTDLLRILQKDP